MKMLTVEGLIDIVDSQLCLHGNRGLFIKDVGEYYVDRIVEFQLFAGSGTNEPILDCCKYGDRCYGDGGLDALYHRLMEIYRKPFGYSEIIHCSDDRQFINGFSIGFQSQIDGFVETLNSSELIQPTIVVEG